MNIWYISKYTAPPSFGRLNSRVFLLCQEFYKVGNRVTVIFSDSNHMASVPKFSGRYIDGDYNGIQFRCIKTLKYKKSASLLRVVSWFDFELKLFRNKIERGNVPEIVIVSSLSLLTVIYGYYLKKRFKSKLVFEVRDIWPLTLVEDGEWSKWNPLVIVMGWIEKFGYRHADLIVGTMPRLDLHVRKITSKELPFFCSPLGFNPIDYYRDETSVMSRFQEFKVQGMLTVGYAGSMGISNALNPYIDAIKLLKNEKIQFFFVGSGDLKEKFELELNAYNNVIFFSKIEQVEVKDFIKVCDVMYLSTKKSEIWEYGQSMNKVIEYMASAKPIVASYSGYKSMINEADCGFFIESTNPNDIANFFINLKNDSGKNLEEIGQRGKDWLFEHRKYSLLAKEYLLKLNQLKVKI